MKCYSRNAILVILLINGWIFCDGACCEGWRSYESSCYYFSPDRLTWDQAFDRCRTLNSQMVEIEDAEENTFIASVFNSSGSPTCAYYIGLTDKNIEGQWKWANSGKPIIFSTWYPGEPNNYEYRDEDCVCLWWEEPGTWNDITCSSAHHYICEMAVTFHSDTTTATSSTEITSTSEEAGTSEVTVPIYVLAVLVLALFLLTVAGLVFIIRRKRSKSETNTTAIYTTDGSNNTGYEYNHTEYEYNTLNTESEGSNYIAVISGNDITERDVSYEIPR